MFDLREALGWLSTGCLYGDGGTRVGGVSTDTRSIEAGDLFVALRGERFDAHDFLAQAQASGAVAVVFERWVPGIAFQRSASPTAAARWANWPADGATASSCRWSPSPVPTARRR